MTDPETMTDSNSEHPRRSKLASTWRPGAAVLVLTLVIGVSWASWAVSRSADAQTPNPRHLAVCVAVLADAQITSGQALWVVREAGDELTSSSRWTDVFGTAMPTYDAGCQGAVRAPSQSLSQAELARGAQIDGPGRANGPFSPHRVRIVVLSGSEAAESLHGLPFGRSAYEMRCDGLHSCYEITTVLWISEGSLGTSALSSLLRSGFGLDFEGPN